MSRPGDSLANLSIGYETRKLESYQEPIILPVTLVTGPLGSGKTTLLKNLLKRKENLRLATIVNDFGTYNYDAELLNQYNDNVDLDGVNQIRDKRNGTAIAQLNHQHKHEDPSHNHHNDDHHHHVTASDDYASNRMERMPPEMMIQLQNGCMCCSDNLQENMKSNIWDLLQLPQDSPHLIDYLIIETSGVTDPLSLISSLDAKFGKMTRVRLDCVVTVLDADSMLEKFDRSTKVKKRTNEVKASQTTEEIQISSLEESNTKQEWTLDYLTSSMISQLQNADVILINKSDLVSTDSLNCLEQFIISSLNSSCRIVKTSYCNVPLSLIMDIDMPVDTTTALSHETTTAFYTVRGGKNLQNLRFNSTTGKGKIDHAKLEQRKGHLATEGLSSFTFESDKPFNLFLLQKLLKNVWSDYHIVRCKGLLYINEDPRYLYRLNISGRKRYSVEVDGIWSTLPKSKVVFIADSNVFTDEDRKKELKEALHGACQDPSTPFSETKEIEISNNKKKNNREPTLAYDLKTLHTHLIADQRLDLLSTNIQKNVSITDCNESTKENEFSMVSSNDKIIWFRITGHRALGAKDSNHLRLQHGIDYDSMNREFLELVNNSGNLFLIGRNIDDYGFFVGLSFVSEEGDKDMLSKKLVENAMDIENYRYEESNLKIMESFLDLLDGIEIKVLNKYEGHLALCKCGH